LRSCLLCGAECDLFVIAKFLVALLPLRDEHWLMAAWRTVWGSDSVSGHECWNEAALTWINVNKSSKTVSRCGVQEHTARHVNDVLGDRSQCIAISSVIELSNASLQLLGDLQHSKRSKSNGVCQWGRVAGSYDRVKRMEWASYHSLSGRSLRAPPLNFLNYRAMPMHSADYVVTRCLSVCPSVTRRYSVETAKHPQTFSPRSHTILVFPNQTW